MGGSVEAINEMEFTFSFGVLDFGEDGTMNEAIQPDTLGYSASGNLILVPGESINFGNNGSLFCRNRDDHPVRRLTPIEW